MSTNLINQAKLDHTVDQSHSVQAHRPERAYQKQRTDMEIAEDRLLTFDVNFSVSAVPAEGPPLPPEAGTVMSALVLVTRVSYVSIEVCTEKKRKKTTLYKVIQVMIKMDSKSSSAKLPPF